ncbi:MAG: hypothetical protein NTV34_21150, partial [Proteobacteria bacterium]|nr:hypothetical protein [Pseudomonadota bacterium]
MNIRYCYSHFKSFTLAIWVLASMAWGSLAFSANREMTEAHRQFMGYLHSEPNLRTWEAYLEPQLSDFTASISAAEDAPINLDLATGLKARLNAAVPFIATHKPTLDRFQNMIASLGHYINANRSSLASIQSQLIAAGPTLQATTSLNRYKSLTQARLNTLASLLGPRVDKYIVRAEHKIDLLEKLLSAPILNKDSIEELMSINNALLAQGVLQGEPAIVALQSAVADWLGELESIDNQTFKAQATEHIATLNRFVNQYPGIIESDQAATVAFKESYAWLYAHHQNRPLLAQLRMSIQRADLHISVTSQFIGSFANKSIDMTIPVSSVEEGTTITGQSVINGNISAVTLPSSQSALLR